MNNSDNHIPSEHSYKDVRFQITQFNYDRRKAIDNVTEIINHQHDAPRAFTDDEKDSIRQCYAYLNPDKRDVLKSMGFAIIPCDYYHETDLIHPNDISNQDLELFSEKEKFAKLNSVKNQFKKRYLIGNSVLFLLIIILSHILVYQMIHDLYGVYAFFSIMIFPIIYVWSLFVGTKLYEKKINPSHIRLSDIQDKNESITHMLSLKKDFYNHTKHSC